jgi:hypothetical protein
MRYDPEADCEQYRSSDNLSEVNFINIKIKTVVENKVTG